jgi:transposase
MVQAVRSGRSQQQVAREFGVSPATVNRWVGHARGQRLDRVDWSDRPRSPHTTQRTEAGTEDLVLEVRRQMQAESDSGFVGAEAIREALRSRGAGPLPAERTIYRILRRRGALDARHRIRRPPPPRAGICRRWLGGGGNSTASTS